MRRTPLILGLLLPGCAYKLGLPPVDYGEARPLPLVQPSTDKRRWYVPVESDTLGPYLFFVDTGYTYSTCDDGLVDGLGLETRGRVNIRGELGKVHATKTRLRPLELGGHRVRDLVCQVRDLDSTSSIGDPDEVPIAGVLGMDVLRRFHVIFDPESGQVHLRDPSEVEGLPRDGEGVSRLKRTTPWVGLRARVALKVDGRTQWPILDTGATSTYVDGAQHGLEPSYHIDGVTVRGTGQGGTSIRTVSYYELDGVTVGGVPTGPVTLMDRDRPWWESGLLGLDLLSRFHQEYDFKRGRVRFSLARARALPQWVDAQHAPGGRLHDADDDALTEVPTAL